MRYVFKKKILILIVSLFDLFGYIIFGIARLFFRKLSKPEPSRILIIRIDHIGDVVLAACVIKPLREKYPDAVIDFLAPVWASELIRDNPDIDNVLEFDPPWFSRISKGLIDHLKAFSALIDILKLKKYDTVIDLRGDLRHILAMYLAGVETRISFGITGGGFLLTCKVLYIKSKHESIKNLSLLSPLGIINQNDQAKIFYSEKDLINTVQLKEEAGVVGSYAIIHAVPGLLYKGWSKTNFSEVVRYIRDIKKILPVFIGTEKDKAFVQEIIGLLGGGVVDLSGKTSLKTMSKLIEQADLFVGLDSGPAHIASITDTPGVVLFSGLNDEEQWAPVGKNLKIICPGRNVKLSAISSTEVCRTVDGLIGIKVIRGNKNENWI